MPVLEKKMIDRTMVLIHHVNKKDLICDKVCDPGETRTLGPLIKSQLLYQLSYGVAKGPQNYR